MVAVVKSYINHRTGKIVPIEDYMMVGQMHKITSLPLLIDMYTVAMNFFNNDPRGSIEILK